MENGPREAGPALRGVAEEKREAAAKRLVARALAMRTIRGFWIEKQDLDPRNPGVKILMRRLFAEDYELHINRSGIMLRTRWDDVRVEMAGSLVRLGFDGVWRGLGDHDTLSYHTIMMGTDAEERAAKLVRRAMEDFARLIRGRQESFSVLQDRF